MTRYALAGHFSPDDHFQPPDEDGVAVTRLDLVGGDRRLRYGIGQAMDHLWSRRVRPSEIGVDLMVVAVLVHALDTRVKRVTASQDGWTRELRIVAPVSDPAQWQAAAPTLTTMLRFLTGDHWDVAFRARPRSFGAVSLPALPNVDIPNFDGVSLFSGGLDSLIGALNALAGPGRLRPLFVSHKGEGAVSGPQGALFQRMSEGFARQQPTNRTLEGLRYSLSFKRNLIAGSEDSTRGRSFLFLALGAFAGSGLPGHFDLRIPENGLIALNVPLDPTRIGSNSTRTTHPFYLRRWNDLLTSIGIPGTVVNPYWNFTKGEMVASCLMPDLLKELIPLSVSCAHPSLKRWSKDDNNHCGTCVPCIIRRAAIEAALGVGNDPTGYRCGDLTAQPLSAKSKDGKQVRGYQYALGRLAQNPDLARILIHKPGPLREDVDNLDKLIGVYDRGMKEVGRLLTGVTTI
ncbi:Qat anti-phage system QueC-like protein QatC [Acidisphaera sp. S103]|uniref:Qat anti-phage system QueC-like protein QatC n=1 Tax=Acidisphaera sp. S103 TaxID=1747223 RepID=UPI00131B9035|nr:Qat anti-phage system QueC-like protein QatC [Acidisphaera sp. S103]